MTERPILMNGAMVRAVLEGRKTQTRRAVKGEALRWLEDGFTHEFVADYRNSLCPFGQPGDRLWVREAFRELEYPTMLNKFDYRVSAEWRGDADKYKWKPSIHMPRWASRITLEITGVRVERLNDISEADAMAEGADCLHEDDLGQTFKTYKRGFQSLWESINGQGSWEASPWVWVIEFKMVLP